MGSFLLFILLLRKGSRRLGAALTLRTYLHGNTPEPDLITWEMKQVIKRSSLRVYAESRSPRKKSISTIPFRIRIMNGGAHRTPTQRLTPYIPPQLASYGLTLKKPCLLLLLLWWVCVCSPSITEAFFVSQRPLR